MLKIRLFNLEWEAIIEKIKCLINHGKHSRAYLRSLNTGAAFSSLILRDAPVFSLLPYSFPQPRHQEVPAHFRSILRIHNETSLPRLQSQAHCPSSPTTSPDPTHPRPRTGSNSLGEVLARRAHLVNSDLERYYATAPSEIETFYPAGKLFQQRGKQLKLASGSP